MNKEIKLNSAQQKAVDTIEGPVLVVAGPGTGKTQLLSMRVKNICEKTDTDPASILVVTFTESGVQAVRQRLRELMGPTGYRVVVNTFHGFCQSVIESYPEKFMFARNLQNIGDFEKIELWRELCDELRPKKLKTLGDPYYYVKDLISRISELKREDITPADFRKSTLDWIREMEAEPKINKRTGEPTQAWKSEREQGDKALELADFYENYQKKLRERGMYDYEDMIMMVVEQFRQDPDLLADYQERFLYIMVDEYQDTNSAQNNILKLLGSGDPDGRPNIMVVGDDDQSVYRFQGASLENILFFEKSFKDPEIIVLVENYRSTAEILKASDQSIANNKQRLDVDKKLRAQTKGAMPDVLEFENSGGERFWLSNDIKERAKKGSKYNDLAVLVRTNREVVEIAEFLMQQEIPVVFTSRQGILEMAPIRLLIDYLTLIVDPNDDEALVRIMSSELVAVDNIDVYRLTTTASRRNYNRKWPVSIFSMISKDEEVEKIEFGNLSALRDWTQKIADWQKMETGMVLPMFFEKFIEDIDFVKWINKDEGQVENLRALNALFSEIKNLAAHHHGFTLKDFIERMRVYREYGLEILEEPFLSPREGVRVMTAHKAKGLEFPVVYIVQCTDKNWGNRRVPNNIKLPPNLLTNQPGHEAIEDERRLFYVAMTRAEKELIITYAKEYGSSDRVTEKQPSQFVVELEGSVTMENKEVEEDFNDLEFLEKRLQSVKLTDSEEDFLRSRLQDYKLSVTNLETYLKCPSQFKWAHLYQLPRAKNKHMILGTAFHKALEIFFQEYKKSSQIPSKDYLISNYKEALKYEVLTDAERDEMIELGEEGLSGYYDNWKDSMVLPLANEYNFTRNNVMLGEARLTGKIDKIEPLGKPVFGAAMPVRVVDYKTGRARTINEIRGETKYSDGAMLRQILFYKILTKQDPEFARKYDMQQGQLDFVQGRDSKYQRVDVDFTEQEVKDLEELITEVWDKIMNLDFGPEPERQKCSECPYEELCTKR